MGENRFEPCHRADNYMLVQKSRPVSGYCSPADRRWASHSAGWVRLEFLLVSWGTVKGEATSRTWIALVLIAGWFSFKCNLLWYDTQSSGHNSLGTSWMNVHAMRSRQLVYQQIIKAWMVPFPIVSEGWPPINMFRGDMAKTAVTLLGRLPRERWREALRLAEYHCAPNCSSDTLIDIPSLYPHKNSSVR